MGDGDSAWSDTRYLSSRRRFLLTAGTAAMGAGMAGCTSVTNFEFSTKPVVLPESARANMGYETIRSKPVVKEHSRVIGGVEVDVTIKNHVSVYGAIEGSRRGTTTNPIVGITSTPKAAVMGRSFNPLSRLSLANLLTSVTGTDFLRQANVDEIGHSRSKIRWERGPRFIASREGTCLDTQTTLESYAGILGGDPQSVAFVHLSRVEADSVVITAAVNGHDIDEPGRPFVDPDVGYLTPDRFEETVATFADATTAVRYRGGA